MLDHKDEVPLQKPRFFTILPSLLLLTFSILIIPFHLYFHISSNINPQPFPPTYLQFS